MGLERIGTSPSNYVVLDVETNGLESQRCDLLSISLYRPDTGAAYSRLLPLDLNDDVYTTKYNGLRKEDIEGAEHLTQDEVDRLFDEFEIDKRTVLHYGNLDVRFVRDYFARHNIKGFLRMCFYNFKQQICASGFSDGSLTKDNLCRFFNIPGVEDVHNGANDCLLEWKLFEKIDGRYLLGRLVSGGKDGEMQWRLSAINPGYIIPVSYLATYSNLSRIIDRPRILCDDEEVFRLEITGDLIKRFPTNFSGMVIENLFNSALDVAKVDNSAFLEGNAAKNELLGYMPSQTRGVPTVFNADGTVSMALESDGVLEKEINASTKQIAEQIRPLIDFIRRDIFQCKQIMSQELVVDSSMGILALCDLSTEDAILEMKTSSCNSQSHAEQLYYESRGRASYLLGMDWRDNSAVFSIRRVHAYPGEKRQSRRNKIVEELKSALIKHNIEVVGYARSTEPVGVRCLTCRHEWEDTVRNIRGGKCVCPQCQPEQVTKGKSARGDSKKVPSGAENATDVLVRRASRYAEKVSTASDGRLEIVPDSYTGSRDPVTARCIICGNVWVVRADHLLSRCYCAKCRREESQIAKMKAGLKCAGSWDAERTPEQLLGA